MTPADYVRIAMEFPTLALALYVVHTFSKGMDGVREELSELRAAILNAVIGARDVKATLHEIQEERHNGSAV